MTKLTATNIVNAIKKLPPNSSFDYPNKKTKTKIQVVKIGGPEGPIIINRFNPSAGQGPKSGKTASISANAIRRLANAISENKPVNVDRVFGGSFNYRSALEALLLHTPEFYTCYPGRIELASSSTKVVPGHKHMLWTPDDPHQNGIMLEKKSDAVISEVSSEVVYDALQMPTIKTANAIDIALARRHAQMQIALILIGTQLGFRTWVANNDKGIIYKNQKLSEMTSVIPRLQDEKILTSYDEAVAAASLIDCIWFKNGRLMPAVIEIEHSTGVTTGLSRMKNFYDHAPLLKDVRWVIVAPDEDRDKVMREANKTQFQELEIQFMPYSAVEELYSLCNRRKITGVSESFLNSFMEPCLGNA